jgi:hypothetical protein
VIQVTDPLEDLLRQTFMVKAEDMAPGDGGRWEEPPTPDNVRPIVTDPAAARTASGRRRPLLAAAAVLVVVAAGAVGVLVLDGDGEGANQVDTRSSTTTAAGTLSDRTQVAELAEQSRIVAVVLSAERGAAIAVLTAPGEPDEMQLRERDRTRTDASDAVDALGTALASSPAAEQYQEATDALAGLDDLRATTDAAVAAGPASAAAVIEAQSGYDSLIEAVLTAQEASVAAIDDPALRADAEAHLAMVRQLVAADRTSQATTWALDTMAPGQAPPPEVVDVLRAADEQEDAARAALTAAAAGTSFENLFDAVLDETAASVEVRHQQVEALARGDIDAAAEAAGDHVGESTSWGWIGFVLDVERLIANPDAGSEPVTTGGLAALGTATPLGGLHSTDVAGRTIEALWYPGLSEDDLPLGIHPSPPNDDGSVVYRGEIDLNRRGSVRLWVVYDDGIVELQGTDTTGSDMFAVRVSRTSDDGLTIAPGLGFAND